ncbi:Anaphase-promoting complex subunit 23 [Aspergillus fumigatus]
MVLGTQTTFFRGKAGDIDVNGCSIHIIWRTLELIYCGDYTEQPCPKTNIPDICDDLNRHAAVCQLAELWGLPQGLREIAYQKYKAIAQDTCRSKDFAPSAENVTSQPFSM